MRFLSFALGLIILVKQYQNQLEVLSKMSELSELIVDVKDAVSEVGEGVDRVLALLDEGTGGGADIASAIAELTALRDTLNGVDAKLDEAAPEAPIG